MNSAELSPPALLSWQPVDPPPSDRMICGDPRPLFLRVWGEAGSSYVILQISAIGIRRFLNFSDSFKAKFRVGLSYDGLFFMAHFLVTFRGSHL